MLSFDKNLIYFKSYGTDFFSFFKCTSGLESFCCLSLCHGFWICGQKFTTFRPLCCISVPEKGSLIQRGHKEKGEAKINARNRKDLKGGIKSMLKCWQCQCTMRTGMVEAAHEQGRVDPHSWGQSHDLWGLSWRGPALPAPSRGHWPQDYFVT